MNECLLRAPALLDNDYDASEGEDRSGLRLWGNLCALFGDGGMGRGIRDLL